MKVVRGVLVVAMAGLLLSGCAAMNERFSKETQTGAGIGAVAGGILGALIDSNRPWRGAIIGAVAGGAAGGWIGHSTTTTADPVVDANADIVNQAARDAAVQNATVQYTRTTEAGVREEVIATPGARTGNLRLVTVRYYRNGTLVSTETRNVSVY